MAMGDATRGAPVRTMNIFLRRKKRLAILGFSRYIGLVAQMGCPVCQIVSSTLLLWCGFTRNHLCGSAFFLRYGVCAGFVPAGTRAGLPVLDVQDNVGKCLTCFPDCC